MDTTKISWKPGNMLYPLPAVIVTVGDKTHTNAITVAWTGTICSDPPMVSISVRKSRYSHNMLLRNREFVINLTNKDMVKATDYCGVKSGKNENKLEKCRLTLEDSKVVNVKQIIESPVNIECKITKIIELGSHDMFMAKVVNINVDSRYLDGKNKFHFAKSEPIVYSHGEYFTLGRFLGKFGFSVRKRNKKKKNR